MSMTCTTCPYCGVGCGVLASADGTIKGDPDHPSNFGRLCSKGSALGETITLEGRLLAPMINKQRASWEEATALVAEKFSAAIKEHGPDSVAFYVSGQLLTEDYYVANKLMKGFIGSANIDTNSRLCMASSVAGHKRAFGTDTVPGTYEDFEEADLVVLVGSNLAWCHPILFQRLVAAKQARPDMRVVNIDPRVTATSDLADLHLAINADSDTALFNHLLAEIASRGAVDDDYVAKHVNGFADALAAAQDSDVSSTGLSAAEIEDFTNLWINTERVVTIYSQGVNQSAVGTDKVNAILNCHLATGRIGRAGMGPFSVTGQPNAMGGREVGGLANMLANHLDLENPDHRDTVQTAWNAPVIADHAGLKAVDLFQACADGKIKALWVMSTNPAVSMPDAANVAQAIENVPFTVVSDILKDTDTGALADVLLPAAGWGEKSGTVTNSERRISRQRAFLPLPGETRPDWQIICDVAQKMGFGEAFEFTSPAEVFAEYAALSEATAKFGKDFDISGLAGLDEADYDVLKPTQWPIRANGSKTERFFADGGFFHADSKAKMLPVKPPKHAENGETFRLNTGRIRDQWHTMTRTARAPRLNQHLAEPFAEINPTDALRLGIKDATLLRISGEHGSAVVRAMITSKVQAGTIFVPMHWTAQFAASGRVNHAVAPVTDPVSGQPALKGANVTVAPFEAAFYAFAASDQQIESARRYVAKSKTTTGWKAEISGQRAPKDWGKEARETLGLDGGEAVMLEDAQNGIARVAIFEDSRLRGVYFAARTPVAVARGYVCDLIGSEASAHVLAGVPGADQPDPGATVCSCMNVGINTLKAAISDGARTVEALGECTGAGTNCGSCKPELQALLKDIPSMKVAAE
ncbi:molybdopterin-dependent oxidoreductase [Halocynthiibacter sp. C4]|uniref:nitrate reductase n=1 Tax=Halocynthiibacter sp. C4 TaxID=2992758 RepID=UPI00237A09FD|nr:nitrate reductase [Halocynthiibacter sp. C4]MDE0590484.1 molybdopterin-dependent oxidoreductase [Halocynthiibacter sp. C4]